MSDSLVAEPYYCHICHSEVIIRDESFMCPVCSNGFVEVLPWTSAVPSNAAADSDDIPSTSHGTSSALHVSYLHSTVHGDSALVNGNDTIFSNGATMYLASDVRNEIQQRNRLSLNMSMFADALDDIQDDAPPPLLKAQIDAIATISVTEDNIQCSVCLEEFNVGDSVRKLPCSHIFHEDCIVPWLNLHGVCPICRSSSGFKFVAEDERIEMEGNIDNGGTVADADANQTRNQGTYAEEYNAINNDDEDTES